MIRWQLETMLGQRRNYEWYNKGGDEVMETVTIAVANSEEEAGEFASAISLTYSSKYGRMCTESDGDVHKVMLEIPPGRETGLNASLSIASLKGFVDGYRALKYKGGGDKIICNAIECKNHHRRNKTKCKLSTTKLVVHTGGMSKEQWQVTCGDFKRKGE